MRRRRQRATITEGTNPLEAAFDRFAIQGVGDLQPTLDRHGLDSEQVSALAITASMASMLGAALTHTSATETVATAFLMGLGVGAELERG